jgi:hypothetical protein
LAVRDGQLDTRLAAERGVKAAYVQRGHEHDCDDDSADDAPGTSPEQPSVGGQPAPGKPNGTTNARQRTEAAVVSNWRFPRYPKLNGCAESPTLSGSFSAP